MSESSSHSSGSGSSSPVHSPLINAVDAGSHEDVPELVLDNEALDSLNEESSDGDSSTGSSSEVSDAEDIAEGAPREEATTENANERVDEQAVTEVQDGSTEEAPKTDEASDEASDEAISTESSLKDETTSATAKQPETPGDQKDNVSLQKVDKKNITQEAVDSVSDDGDEDSHTSSSDASEEGEDDEPIINFHNDTEDLYLRVKDAVNDGKNNTSLYHVLCANFASASPIWRKYIYGGKNPRPAAGKWVIDMLDDDAYGMRVLLYVVHYLFDDLPERPTVDQLYRITLMADKYKCIHLLRPYIKSWGEGMSRELTIPEGHSVEDDKVLFIAWASGNLKTFPSILHRVINETSIEPDGTLVDGNSRKWKDSAFPSQIIDIISDTRQQKIAIMLSAIQTPVENLLKQVNIGTNDFCRAREPDEKRRCEHAQLGSLIQGLYALKLYPFKSAPPYLASVDDLAALLSCIKISKLSTNGLKPHQDIHGGCATGYKHIITSHQSKLPDLTAYAFTHLEEKAKASGAYKLLHEQFENAKLDILHTHNSTDPGMSNADELALRDEYQVKKRKFNSD